MAEFEVVETADGSRTLRTAEDGQAFASLHGALTEAEHVYLHGAGVARRLEEGRPTDVLEVGFGTGLNFLVTARAAVASGTPLTYTAIEQRPVPVEVLTALGYDRLAGLETLAPSLWDALSFSSTSEVVRLGGPVQLRLRVEDARGAELPAASFDAVYHDPFSPAVNPELWTPALLNRLFAALRPGGTLATYCAKGTVRRALLGVGFEVTRRPGPPGKREILVARRPA